MARQLHRCEHAGNRMVPMIPLSMRVTIAQGGTWAQTKGGHQRRSWVRIGFWCAHCGFDVDQGKIPQDVKEEY